MKPILCVYPIIQRYLPQNVWVNFDSRSSAWSSLPRNLSYFTDNPNIFCIPEPGSWNRESGQLNSDIRDSTDRNVTLSASIEFNNGKKGFFLGVCLLACGPDRDCHYLVFFGDLYFTGIIDEAFTESVCGNLNRQLKYG